MIAESNTPSPKAHAARASSRAIARQTASGFVWTAAALVAGFATKVLMSGRMSPADMGVVVAAQSLVGLVLAAAELGMPDAVVRFVGREATLDRAPRGTVDRAVVIVSASTTAVACLVLAGLWLWFRGRMSSDALWATTLAIASLPLLGIGDVIGAAHRGVNRVGAKIILTDVARPTVVAAGLVLSPLLFTRYAPYVAGLYALAALASAVGVWTVFLRDRRWQPGGATTSTDLLRFGLPIAGVAVLAGPLVNSGLPLMLSYWAGAAAVTFYSIAVALQAIAYLPISVLELAVLPTWARMAAQSDVTALAQSFQHYTQIGFAGATCAGLLILGSDTAILSLLFGPAIQVATAGALKGTIAAGMWASMAGPNEAMLRALGRSVEIFKARVAAAVVGVAVGLICIPPFGLAGAVAAFAAATVAVNAVYGAMLYAVSGIHPLSRAHALTSAIAVLGLATNVTMTRAYPVAAFVVTTGLAVLVLIINADLRSALRALAER